MRLGLLTALDLSGVRPRRHADGCYDHECVTCGFAARTGSWHTQCSNPSCATQVFSALDLVVKKTGKSYTQASDFVNDQLRREVITRDDVQWESDRRRVLDFWLQMCGRGGSTLPVAAKLSALRDKGWPLLPEQRGAVVISAEDVGPLLDLADATGATYPDSMRLRPPPQAMAYAVQSLPHTIDRIILTTGGKREVHIVWRRKRVGMVGMINSGERRLLVADFRQALALQRRLLDLGDPQEVAAVFYDREGEACREQWRPDVSEVLAVNSSAADVVALSAFYEAFPAAQDTLLATHESRLLSPLASPVLDTMRWTWMRRSYMAAAVAHCSRELDGGALMMLEQTHATREEIAWLIQRIQSEGRLDTAEEIRHCMMNRIIVQDGRTKVRETVGAYILDHGGGDSTIANFALQLGHNLFFRDSPDVFHTATLTYGRTSIPVTISASSVDNTNELQKTIRHQMLMARGGSADQLPTIVDVAAMRRYIVPHLKRQVATLKSEEGFCNLGWTLDRSMFVGPGIKVSLNGRTKGRVPRHPGVAYLRHFADTAEWGDGFSCDLPPAARDIIAMTLASCVRFVVKSVTRPICVQHSPEARHLLTTMFATLGQTEIFELNPNARDHTGSQGIRGYPFLTTGYNAAQAHNARFGHVLLTDSGYSVREEVAQDAAEAAGRSLQYGLLRVVEWCLATGAELFSETPSLQYNHSLLREGKWLIENVCELQPWEVSDMGLTHLEGVLSQIPVTETLRRMVVKDGTVLTADLSGLNWDRDLVREDLRALRSRCDGEGDQLVMGAVEVIPALELYYGRRPEVALDI